MHEFLKRNTPPGIDIKPEYHTFLAGNIVAFIVAFIGFLTEYIEARDTLYTYAGSDQLLIDGAVITPFHKLINISFSGFFIIAAIMLCFIIYHYFYFRQGSMSIYLMKRLPKKNELYRRTLTLPCLAALITVASAAATVLLCFIIYLTATPPVCLPYAAFKNLRR